MLIDRINKNIILRLRNEAEEILINIQTIFYVTVENKKIGPLESEEAKLQNKPNKLYF